MASSNCKMFKNHISIHWHYPSLHVAKMFSVISHIFETIKRSVLVAEYWCFLSPPWACLNPKSVGLIDSEERRRLLNKFSQIIEFVETLGDHIMRINHNHYVLIWSHFTGDQGYVDWAFLSSY